QEVIGELEYLYAGLGAEIETAIAYAESIAPLPDVAAEPHARLADAQSLAAHISRYFRRLDYSSAVRMYTMANADLEMRVTEMESLFHEGNMLVEGVASWEEGIGLHTVRYPIEGIAVLSRVTQYLGAGIAVSSDLLAQYAAEDPIALAAAEMNVLHAAAQALHSRLLGLESQNAAALVAAGSQVDRANALRIDGDRLLQAAQEALAREDFSAARGNLERAVEQYDASLALQESAALRNFRDVNVVAFGHEMARTENEVVVRDVRNLVTAARASYFAGNLEQAEVQLVQAQNRWRVTNVTEQPEVEHWLRLVRGALSLNLARVIPPTAPLFAEMSQLLSTANRSYAEGVSHINAGRRSRGVELFNDALDKTREVRLIFPMNHSARILELRIEQQIDITAFNANFQQRLNQAVAGARVGDPEAFVDLQDLAEINPQFPGIQGMLVQAEIAMGFRPPPPNPADLARSAELTRTAAPHVDSGDPVLLSVAETQLGEAIALDPNNTQAQILMDRLHILLGIGTPVLSSHDQAQYNIALQEFLRGNHLTANAIVQQLLLNPENQRSPIVMELQRRISSVL
ncbi:MAG: hypothetical protein FWC65_01765, partial [Treponema sp.]|nr:hypothetical protein [Treponema sp.]